MDRPAVYQIRVRGQLDRRWSTWFEELTVDHAPEGDTTLTGVLADQSALHGVLARIRDLGLDLVSVEVVEAPRPQTEEVRHDGVGEC